MLHPELHQHGRDPESLRLEVGQRASIDDDLLVLCLEAVHVSFFFSLGTYIRASKSFPEQSVWMTVSER